LEGAFQLVVISEMFDNLSRSQIFRQESMKIFK